MAIWNMIARLTLDQNDFSANTKKAVRSMRDLSSDSNKTLKSLLSWTKAGASLMGLHLTLRAVGQGVKTFLQDTTTHSLTASREVDKLSKSWMEFKSVLERELAPVIEDFLRGLNKIVSAGDRMASEFAGGGIGRRFESLTPEAQISLRNAYETQRGAPWGFHKGVMGMGFNGVPITGPMSGFGENADYADRLLSAYERSWGKNIVGSSTGASYSEMTKARDEIDKLTSSLNDQLLMQEALNNGEKNVAEQWKFNTTLLTAYDDNVAEMVKRMFEYEAKLRELDDLKSRGVVAQYVESMRQENAYLSELASGDEKQAEWLKTINDLKKQGVDLNEQEKSQIQTLKDEHEELAKQIVQRSKAQEQAIRMVKQAADGLGDSIAGAVIYSENLGDNLKTLARQLAFQYLSQAISSGGQKAGTAAVNWVASKFHEGGVVGQSSSPQASVPAALFAHAPRLHSGYLGSDEFAAILKRNETVIPEGVSPSISVVVNNSGTAKTGRARYDPRSATVAVFLDDMDHGGPISQAIGMRR